MGSALFGCVLVVVFGVKILGPYLFQDPCEGDGNFRPPMDNFYYEDEDEEDEHGRN